ncbi:unnamed protein product [Lactuca saligna]|uniref:Uncharacterized protein n=1 Tax=Lactuca saligna TaxID=75948 RepID=A0AA35ZC01_LACSI|nr:unnamed protein product [Lactuca saligna]
MASDHPSGRDLTAEEWESFQFRFGLISEQGVQIPLPDASLYSPPDGKVGILIALSEAGLRLPTIDFFNLIICEYGFFVRELTPIAILGFELLCRALGRQPTVPTFKNSFNASTQSGTWTLSCRTKAYVDHIPTLFGANKELADVLEKININGKQGALRSVFQLTAAVFVLLPGVEEVISLEKALQGLFDGDLQCRDVDLI